MSAPTPNQSYLVKQMQWRVAAAVALILKDLGYNVTKHGPSYNDAPSGSIYYPTGWRATNQKFLVRPDAKHEHTWAYIVFSTARWDGLKSDINYGDTTVDHKAIQSDDGKTKIIKNNTDGPLHVSYEEVVSLTNSFASSITKGVVLDMTESAEVASEQKVSGEYAGVTAEVSLSEKFGISKSKSESSEIGKEEAEEGTNEESLAIEFDAVARTYYLIVITSENEHTQQPFDIDGIMDFDLAIRSDGGHGSKGPSWVPTKNSKYRPPNGKWTVMGVEGLAQFVYGYDTNYPSMQGYIKVASQEVKDAIEWMQEPENRRIQVSGINQASLDSNADYEVRSLGSTIPHEYSDLPVEDAQNVGG